MYESQLDIQVHLIATGSNISATYAHSSYTVLYMHRFSVLTSLEGTQQYIMACIDKWVGIKVQISVKEITADLSLRKIKYFSCEISIGVNECIYT